MSDKICPSCKTVMPGNFTVCIRCATPLGKSISSGRRVVAALLVAGGLAGMIYCALFFGVGIETGNGGSVTNLDLMNQRTNGTIISAALFLAGIILDK